MAVAAAGLAIAATAYGIAEAAPGRARPAPTLIAADAGDLQGQAADGVRSWLGVPYAAPPVGDLRWASPQPAEPWDGVRETTEFASACAQGQGTMPSVPTTVEDCLYLNVYAPDTTRKRLPVLVWFHGGGNSFGAAAQYDPSRLVAEGQAVVVTVNYRLGVFGNFAHPALDEGGETTSGNYGLEDQQAALRWVRQNAAAFGGSSANVTIFGESGGGYDVCAHLAAEGSAGLFDKAIIQSAPCTSDWAPSRAEGQARDLAVAEHLPCTAPANAACLRGLDAEALITASSTLQEFQPVVGGPVMPVATAEAIEAGTFSQVPVLAGINRNEEQLMVWGMELYTGQATTAESYAAALETVFGDAAAAVAGEYPVEAFETPGEALAAVQTDLCWATELAGTVAALAERTDMFAYEMAVEDAPWFVGLDRAGWTPNAYHMADVAYLFDTDIFETRTARQQDLADTMVEAWTTFARSGDPDGRGDWRPADGIDDARRLTADGITGTNFTADHHLDFWTALEH